MSEREAGGPVDGAAQAGGPVEGADGGVAPGQTRAPDGATPGLPAEVFARQAPPRPTRRPRQGDVVLTVLLTLVLYVVAFSSIRDGLDHAHDAEAYLHGLQLATVLAVIAPIVLALFSTVFSIVFLRRRVYAFWLPVFAGVLIVALTSVTRQMLDNAVIIGIHGG